MGCGDRSLLKPLLSGSSGKGRKRGYNNNNTSDDDDNQYELSDVNGDSSKTRAGLRRTFAEDIMAFFRKLWLLIWKNLLFRKRHYILTALEIILPTLLVLQIALLKANSPDDLVKAAQVEIKQGNVVFPVYPYSTIRAGLAKSSIFGSGEDFIAYAPVNDETTKVVDRLKQETSDLKLKWQGYKSEADIEALVGQASSLNTSSLKNDLVAAIIFEKGFSGTGEKNYAYKIRFLDLLQDTKLAFPVLESPGPNIVNLHAYMKSGFLALQTLIDKAIIEMNSNVTLPNEWINVQGFPHPAFSQKFDFANIFNQVLPMMLCTGFVFIATANIKGIVGEKETGIKELLKMLGLPGWMQLIGWLVNSMIILSVSITIIVLLLFVPFNHASGAVLVHSNPTLWWFVLFMFAMSGTAMCFFISSFFQKPTLATAVGVIVWLVTFFAVVLQFDQQYSSMNIMEKMCLALVPHVSLTYAIKILAGWEGKAIGAGWTNLFDPISSVDPLSVGLVLVSMTLSTVIFMSLTLYFESIIPSEYGVRKPWYYIFKLSTWTSKDTADSGRILTPSARDRKTFEADPVGLAPGIDIQSLSKTYGSRIVVNEVCIKMFEGQITALLGHNGAGKTTTISMLTGLISPSNGTAHINGHDIRTNMEAIHANLGLCPQHNMLFDELTVGEHLTFFARLKGMSSSSADYEVKDLLKKLQLSDKINVLSKSLSGGQKRKLNLGIALVGNTKIVILDEPTSGMDPEARRAIWDLLLEMRGQRTILLTTHFMEEADVLGDRIAIMADGQVRCCGTPLFLKRCYGAGYTLNLTIHDKVPTDVILLTVQKYFATAFFKTQQSPSSLELAITIPTENSDTSKFPGMFSELYKRKDDLGIQTIGLSLTTMDDVFIKVGEHTYANDDDTLDDSNGNGGFPNHGHGYGSTPRLLTDEIPRSEGLALAFQQFYALFVKRVIYTVRKRRLFISQLLLPILLVILAILASNKGYHSGDPPPPLKFDFKPYTKPVTLFSTSDLALGKQYAAVVGSSATPLSSANSMIDEMLAIGERDIATYRGKYVVAAELNETTINAMYSTIPFHAAPLSVNLASNTLLKKFVSSEHSIEVTNHPLHTDSQEFDAASANPIFATLIPIIFAILLPLGLALAASSFIVFPVEERLCKAKQLQLMTGVNPVIYWTSSLCWDLLLNLVLVIALIVCFPIFEARHVISTPTGLSVLFAILMMFGFAAISFSYLGSFFAASVVSGFTWVTILHILTGVILCITVFVLDMFSIASPVAATAASFVRLFARVFPTFGASLSTMKFIKTATINSRCGLLSAETLAVLCDPNQDIPLDRRSCCQNCTILYPEAPCFEPKPYIQWSNVEVNEHGKTVTPGIGQEMFFMLLMGVVFQCLIFMIECGIMKRLIGLIFKNRESVVKNVEGDEDVKAENQEIESLIMEGRLSEEALVVTNLSKNFGSFAAVSNLNFRVHHGECFGLLGVNGAGKTTSFRMLTGDEVPSSGNAFASSSSLMGNRREFFASIGYCPQFDGIIGVLSGMEMVKLFCRLRGVRKDHVDREASKYLDRLGLSASVNVPCQKYSGGMKRRLSTAMALVGDPPIIMLDEPTSGVDPIARRQFWGVISTIRASGQAVILTSHSMEECEALCGRLGIMVNGQIQCLGGVEHLKHKYAEGYIIMVKLVPTVDADTPDAQELQQLVLQKFPNTALKDKHQNVLLFQVRDSGVPWDILFQRMEDIKLVHGNIMEDYCINATTLEEIFLSFARKTYNDRVTDAPWYRRMLCLS